MSWRVSTPVGGTGGSPFSLFEETNGNVLRQILVQRLQSSIGWIAVLLTGGTNRSFGRYLTGHIDGFAFAEGERMVELSVWVNNAGTRVSWISFRTNAGRRFSYGAVQQGRESRIDVHSGICVGVEGRHGHEIDRLGFVFLRPVASFRLNPTISYQGVEGSTANITTRILQQLARTTNNDKDAPLYWVFTGSREISSRSSWQLSSPTEGLVSHFNLSASNPRVPNVVPSGPAGASTTFRWSTTGTTGAFPSTDSRGSTSISTTTTAWYHVSGTLSPGQSISKRALIGEGTNNMVTFTGRVDIILSGNTNAAFSIPGTGRYSGNSSSAVQILD